MSWKKSRWGGAWGGHARLKTNYRGWLHKGEVRTPWGREMNRTGGRWRRAEWGTEKARMHGPLKGAYDGTIRGGVRRSTFSQQGDSRAQGGEGGILSRLSLGGGRRSRLREVTLPAPQDFDVSDRERLQAQVGALARRYANGDAEEREQIAAMLTETLGPKYTSLVIDFAARQPDEAEYRRFVPVVVEAAALDLVGREPLSWKILRIVRNLFTRPAYEPQA